VRVVSQDNQGAAHARNVGFHHARGRYIALLDADDWYEPRHLERTSGFLDEHPECSLVGSNYYFIDYRGERTLGCKPGEIMGGPGDGAIPDYFRATMRNRCYPITCGAAFRRGLIKELGEFDPTLDSDEDHDFWTRWAMRSRFGYIDEPLCYYQQDTPASNRKDLEASVHARIRSWRKLTAMESEDLPVWKSYARCRSYYLFRLTALAVAVGNVEGAREVSSYWPASPGHLHWWLGKGLGALPGAVIRAIHSVLGRTDFVRFRQGRPAPASSGNNWKE
jgi:glycosyltransferase involved in cell wall biosynthesis